VSAEFPDAGVPARVDEHALGRYFDGLVAQRRLNMMLLGLFGLLGLLIAAVGIYGVLAYVVSQRTPEIGIRMALGAMPSSILMSVVGAAMLYMCAGLAIGLMSAWGLAELVRGFLFATQPHEPAIYAGALALLLMTGVAAAFGPARRAVHVDPLVALRMD
jgi:ABC-type antimicrobial peptide transport system permease subunit